MSFGGSFTQLQDLTSQGLSQFDILARTGQIPLTDFATNLQPINIPTINMPGGGGFFGPNFSQNAGLALQGLNTIGGLIGAFGSLNLAKKNFRFQKQMAEKNLANQTQSYNTALEDRIRSRASVEGLTPAQAQSYLNENRLKPLGS